MEMQLKNTTRCRRINRLKDEIYRQMFLLEERRSGEELGLALDPHSKERTQGISYRLTSGS
jgi:hypothetical protein